MSDIVKKNGGELMQWEPFRMMRDFFRSDPFREIAPDYPSLALTSFNPSFDVTETNDAFVFKADLPGVNKDEIEITSTGNRLQVSGKREISHETKNDTVYTYERQSGSFARSFTLPAGADIDSATSELKDGVLTLVIPKKPGAQAKKIAVSTGKSKS